MNFGEYTKLSKSHQSVGDMIKIAEYEKLHMKASEKIKMLTARAWTEKHHLDMARANDGSVDYWENAYNNTLKQIDEIKSKQPKTRDETDAISKTIKSVETKNGVTEISFHGGDNKSYKTKESAIHDLLNKGLSAADISRLGFSKMTIQSAKKRWTK